VALNRGGVVCRSRLASLFLFVVVFSILGCGNKTRPVPLPDAIPATITDLRATQEPDGIRLTFSRPDHYVSGKEMRDLNHFIILRAEDQGPLIPYVEAPVPDRERIQKPRTLSYLDRNTLVGHTYRYVIVSVTDDGDKSAPSNEVTVTRAVTSVPSAKPFTSAGAALPK